MAINYYGNAGTAYKNTSGGTRSTPNGDYTINAGPGGASFTGAPNRAAEDAARALQQTGQVGMPHYDIPGGNTGFAGGGGGSMPGGGGGMTPGYQTPGPNSVVTSAGDGGGNINLSREAYERQQEMALKKKYADDMFGKITATSGGGTSGQVTYGNGAAGEAARSAAFARAKEQAGQNANAALKSMHDLTGSRGLRGSSIEAGAEGDIISDGGHDISNVITQQMEDELGNIQHVNDMSYQGGIQQRGQDMNAKQSLMSLLAGLY